MNAAHDPHIAIMSQAARTAGAKLLDRFRNRESLLVEYKNPGDLVSLADRESEDTIIAILDQVFPDYGVMGEEGADRPANTAGYRWIIDPLDATGNFLFGLPFWAVNIALEQQGQIVAGVTFDAIHDELFYAVKGQGAYLNDKPIKTSIRTDLSKAAIGTDMGAPPQDLMPLYNKAMNGGFAQCASAATFRCSALMLAYVAAGRFDIFTHFGKAKAWDIAPGWLLVNEAGGMVTDVLGDPLQLHSGHIFAAANVSLYDQFTSLLKV